MRDAIADAGLPLGCQPHGLRKATGRRFAEAGATAEMIVSVLGHPTRAEAERYTEEANQAGSQKMRSSNLKDTRRTGLPTTSAVWESIEKKNKIKVIADALARRPEQNCELLYC
jgi:hypothetical protein